MKQFIKWLMNLPTNITNNVPDGTVCDYCGATNSRVNFEGTFCICHKCMKKVADAALQPKVSNVQIEGQPASGLSLSNAGFDHDTTE
jgi:ribosomal protein L37AE/L43A